MEFSSNNNRKIFLKVHNPCHCDYSPRVPKRITTPLVLNKEYSFFSVSSSFQTKTSK